MQSWPILFYLQVILFFTVFKTRTYLKFWLKMETRGELGRITIKFVFF